MCSKWKLTHFPLLLCAVATMVKSPDLDNYLQERNRIFDTEKSMFLGRNVTLTEKEHRANSVLLEAKLRELNSSYENSLDFLPSLHFFQAKEKIDGSEVFAMIRRMPKGASLHTHLVAGVPAKFVVESVTYRDNLYGGYIDGVFKLKFLSEQVQDDRCEWISIKEMRENQSAPVFDQWLQKQLTLTVEDPQQAYPSLEAVWAKFKKIFSTTYDLFSYKPVFEECVYQVMQELYDDNIMYAELKGTILPLYELDGTLYSKHQFFEIFSRTVERFKKKHPEFRGVRYIQSVYRGVDKETLQAGLDEIIELKKSFPDLIIGFDLVGFEEQGTLLVEYRAEILRAQEHLKFFFHAGETNWFGHTDLNIADAILFNSHRIGHGFAITKHPALLCLAKERNIPLEICPISNQVLKLNEDPRNHPATYLIANDYPLVVGNDDPSVWNASGLSHDWYVFFMAMTSKMSGIEVLKQLALNSILYSAVDDVEKERMREQWEGQWGEFLDEIIGTK